jgi:DNA replication and repair protein RecF
MVLKQISLRNFRNYKKLILELDERVNVFIGNNAQGKTNLLESIYFLIITKSFRNTRNKDLIKIGEKEGEVRGIIKKDNKTLSDELKILIKQESKLININNKKLPKISEYISKFNIVSFSPSDLDIIKGFPNIRRKFLNIELSQLKNKYLLTLNEYNYLIKTRNEYLKSINCSNCNYDYLNVINDQVINKAIIIYQHRNQFINDLNNIINVIYKKIFGNNDIYIKYSPSILIDHYTDSEIKKVLTKKFEENIEKEIILGQTLIGPHRDDFSFYISEQEIKSYGSQGQQRVAVLCLKLAVVEIIKKEKKEWPIILLDDVFSELDEKIKNNIIDYAAKGAQIIITTTDVNNIVEKIKDAGTIFYVKNAVITRGADEQNE